MWILYSLAAALLWGLEYTLADKLLERIGFPLLLAIDFFFGFLAMVGILLHSGTYKSEIPKLFASGQTSAILGVMIAAFIVANVCIVISIGNKGATLASLIEISYPLFVAVFSWMIFKKGDANLATILGGALIFTGVMLISFFNN